MSAGASSTRKQFQILKGLIQRSDVTGVCNACDAGREGEAICRLVCELYGCTKPMKRLWLSSMEDEAIRAGIIEKLVQKGYLERKGDKKKRRLVSTEKGRFPITVVPEQIQSAALTADWEQKLLQIERGEEDPALFLSEIEEMIRSLVAGSSRIKGAEIMMASGSVPSRSRQAK